MATRPPNKLPGQAPERPSFRPPLGGAPSSPRDIANTNVNFPQTNSVRGSQVIQVVQQGGSALSTSVGQLSGDVEGVSGGNSTVSLQRARLTSSLADGQILIHDKIIGMVNGRPQVVGMA